MFSYNRMCFLIHIQVVSYGYTAHSNKVQKEGEVPTVRLNYDILPVIVQVECVLLL